MSTLRIKPECHLQPVVRVAGGKQDRLTQKEMLELLWYTCLSAYQTIPSATPQTVGIRAMGRKHCVSDVLLGRCHQQ